MSCQEWCVASTAANTWIGKASDFHCASLKACPPRLKASRRGIAAAIAGWRQISRRMFLFEEELASGRLVKAIAQTMEAKDGYYLLHARGVDAQEKVGRFKRWLLARTRTHALREGCVGPAIGREVASESRVA